jgi:hypothetical protein
MEVELMKATRTALILSTMIVLQVLGKSLQASEIHYSWSGFLVPAGVEDPWQIGQGGQPFVLDFVISTFGPDLFPLNVEFAAFEVNGVSFLLDGDEISYLGNGIADFTDHQNSSVDLLTFSGKFEQLGHAIEIGTAVSLPVETLHFLSNVEPPPFFGSTVNVDRSAYSVPGPYVGIVAAGSPVIVVPEPDSLTLLAAWLSLLITRFRSGYLYRSCNCNLKERPRKPWSGVCG